MRKNVYMRYFLGNVKPEQIAKIKIISTLKYINRHMHEASTAEEVLIQRVSYCCLRH